MLPEIDGLDVLRQLSDVYVIMLTARTAETDKIIGLGLGADDYVTKPFSPRELVARVKSALRRMGGGAAATDALVSADIRLDVGRTDGMESGKAARSDPD